jgi:acetyl-CoA C-acetyltransferase
MDDDVILSAARTPIGVFQDALAGFPAHALGARALSAAIERAGLSPEDIQQVDMGCVLTAGQGQTPGRQAALAAGCLPSTGAITLNKVCGSAMRTVMIAANDLRRRAHSPGAGAGDHAAERAAPSRTSRLA